MHTEITTLKNANNDIKEIETRFRKLKDKIVEKNSEFLSAHYNISQSTEILEEKINEYNNLTKDIEIHQKAQKILQELIATYSIEKVKKIEKIVTDTLRVIFYDKNLTFCVDVVDKKNQKSVYFFIEEEHADNVIRLPLSQNSVAGGILVVTAFILQIYFIKYFNLPPFIFLDEAFSQVSDQYIPNLNQFLSSLKDVYGLIIVLITHDPRFSELAERTYEVKNGKYTLIEK